jgi:hypothetical protein
MKPFAVVNPPWMSGQRGVVAVQLRAKRAKKAKTRMDQGMAMGE